MPSEWKQKIIKNFDTQAAQYQRHSDLQGDIAQRLITHLPAFKNAEILEIGCGSGRLSQLLLQKYPDARLHITDISPNMIKEAQKNLTEAHENKQIKWSVMDGEDIAHDQTYDLIVSNMAFQWFETPETSLKTLSHILKPSGRIVFTVPSSHSFPEWTDSLQQTGLPHGFQRPDLWPNIFKEEHIIIDYGSTLSFLRNIKEIGAHTPDKNYSALSAADIKNACKIADEQYGGKITWHILYGEISHMPE